MLPPVDAAILAANPEFEALYRDLCSTKLAEDGSTRLDNKTQKERNLLKDVSFEPIELSWKRRVTSCKRASLKLKAGPPESPDCQREARYCQSPAWGHCLPRR
jgi:hypothetical protein